MQSEQSCHRSSRSTYAHDHRQPQALASVRANFRSRSNFQITSDGIYPQHCQFVCAGNHEKRLEPPGPAGGVEGPGHQRAMETDSGAASIYASMASYSWYMQWAACSDSLRVWLATKWGLCADCVAPLSLLDGSLCHSHRLEHVRPHITCQHDWAYSRRLADVLLCFPALPARVKGGYCLPNL